MLSDVEKRVDSLTIMVLLTLSGGFQDAYTFFMRHSVFANGQTGNIVLMSSYIFSGNYKMVLHYLIPVLSYAIGIFLADTIEGYKKELKRFGHWQHIVLYIEIIFLFIVGFLPDSLYHLANALVSFSCALQVASFRTVRGYSYASTMCVGNIKLGMSALSKGIRGKDDKELKKSAHYFLVIFIFALGAGLGAICSKAFELRAIWCSAFTLFLALILLLLPIKKKR